MSLVLEYKSRAEAGPATTAELEGPTVVGRGPDCALRPDDILLSRRHFRLFEREGVWHAEDVGSAAGTWLNGAQLRGARALEAGDELQAGGTVFRVARAD
ncbi:MAG: FHA domain-containing protein [Myxococcales bacterium]|nr:FHA domain-containing protein [Myxococcales bacterium]MCB9645024.1 FHA domain-containing protein [Deltaproteobacteria bacterium]